MLRTYAKTLLILLTCLCLAACSTTPNTGEYEPQTPPITLPILKPEPQPQMPPITLPILKPEPPPQTPPITLPDRGHVAPILRPDTGMHTAIIKKIDVDAAERYLVTGSDDKTVRVWSLPDGRLLRVLRPPIGKGHEGKVYAVAISPNGKTVAVGGWTSQTGSDNAIYLFNRATGELRQRITGLPNRILHLAYSPDGNTLVASLKSPPDESTPVASLIKKGGIRLYRTSDYRLQAQDTDYGAASYWAEFDTTGRLVTTCKDGYIRLYNKQFKLLTKRKAVGGHHPFAARFSPTGDKIAVGFQDSTRVNVLSGQDLNLLYSPNTQGVNNGSLDNLAWSQDGNWLYAGGRYQKDTKVRILRWAMGGQGSYTAWPASTNSIMGIRALRKGRIVFAAAEPAFGLFNANGQKIFERKVEIADFRGDHIRLSKDGNTVQFGYKYGGKSPARFSLKKRTLILDPPAPSKLTAPRFEGLKINTTKPKLNGKALSLKRNEIVRSLAIAPNGQHFLLGTQWFLRFFDKQGKLRWKADAPSTAWGVNIAGNGKVAIAAFGDGTLRWYRLRDGQELLAFFPHKDRKRWIVWTPQGYYAASSGGEALIGWHLNRGPNQAADFFSAARFRDNYYRPDVVAKVLDTLDPGLQERQQALQAQLPPVVTLLSPQDNATFSNTDIELRYRIRSPSNKPVTGIKVLIDGRPLKGLQRIPPQSSLRVTVPGRDVEVSLIAENKYAASEPATVRLRWQGTTETIKKPTLYVLAVGVGDFDNASVQKLNYAAQDARDLTQLFKAQKNKGLYRDVQIKRLEDANKEEILEGLEWIERQTTQNDVLVVSFSGHGVNEKGLYYFIPRDVDPDQIESTAVPYRDIKSAMAGVPGKALFLIDTCHSGNIMGGLADVNKIANDLSSAENGIVVFTSSTGTQTSMEDTRWQNGAFTEALLEGLKGQADYQKDGEISITELELYLSHRVKELTNQHQTPTTAKPQTIVDFSIVFVR
ncbi:MAG: caspase family protein [Pseudomonadota bacterium]